IRWTCSRDKQPGSEPTMLPELPLRGQTKMKSAPDSHFFRQSIHRRNDLGVQTSSVRQHCGGLSACRTS
ncbi:MAG: hypothetical protein ACRD2L_22490, partial [Terriglobia bacterium]